MLSVLLVVSVFVSLTGLNTQRNRRNTEHSEGGTCVEGSLAEPTKMKPSEEPFRSDSPPLL